MLREEIAEVQRMIDMKLGAFRVKLLDEVKKMMQPPMAKTVKSEPKPKPKTVTRTFKPRDEVEAEDIEA